MGLAISKHYCSGSFVSASLFQEAESCCGESDCCHNETNIYQVKDDFSTPTVLSAPVLAELDVLGHDLFADLFIVMPETETSAILKDSSPPPKTIQTVLSLKQVYRL